MKDLRKTHYSRAEQIAMIAQMLSVGAKNPTRNNDGEEHECNQEALYYAVYDCTYEDVVLRAVAAAKKAGNWGAAVVAGAAADRAKKLKELSKYWK
jgi:hypothetical protein